MKEKRILPLIQQCNEILEKEHSFAKAVYCVLNTMKAELELKSMCFGTIDGKWWMATSSDALPHLEEELTSFRLYPEIRYKMNKSQDEVSIWMKVNESHFVLMKRDSSDNLLTSELFQSFIELMFSSFLHREENLKEVSRLRGILREFPKVMDIQSFQEVLKDIYLAHEKTHQIHLAIVDFLGDNESQVLKLCREAGFEAEVIRSQSDYQNCAWKNDFDYILFIHPEMHPDPDYYYTWKKLLGTPNVITMTLMNQPDSQKQESFQTPVDILFKKSSTESKQTGLQ